MPISKRDKKVSLTKTAKKGKDMKTKLIENIRKHLEEFDHLYVFTVNNMRNGPLKEVREDWKGSRFFYAKKKIMAIALGRDKASESQKNLHKIAMNLTGQCGLLFTNKPKDYVVEWFQNFSKMDYAKSGFVATRTVTLPAGPLPEFSHAIEPHLRQLGLPTRLEKGIIVLLEEYTICKEGAQLKPEEANILKLVGVKMAEFKITLVCMWSKDGSFEKFKNQKHILKMAQSFDGVKHKEILNKKMEKSKQLKEAEINQEKITNKLQPGEDIVRHVTKLTILEHTSDQGDSIPQEKAKLFKTFTPKVDSETPMEEDDFVAEICDPTSPHFGKNNPRRSMRTPKPIKRTPEQLKRSAKRLSVTATKIQKSTPKGTPKKSRGLD